MQPTTESLKQLAFSYGLTNEEWLRLQQSQQSMRQQNPTPTEIAIAGALWSEHCSYKSSKIHFKKLFMQSPYVVTSAGENAGAIDLGDDDIIVFKMESHNHPSYLEPYQGAATGVGGIMRDIFTMGATPIANVNALRFGQVGAVTKNENHSDSAKWKFMQHLTRGVIRGLSHYGNATGVPMVTGETEFLPCYNGNILVNAMTVGLVHKKTNMASAVAAGVGNWVIYLGSSTGLDGVKGAVMASQEFAGNATAQKPSVQVGDPFAEKLLMDLCLELIQQKQFITIQDMGAAGLSSASAEMAHKGNVGIELNLDQVPLRQPAMLQQPETIMLSESQERMLAVIKPENFIKIQQLFRQHHLHCEKIGQVIADPLLRVTLNHELLAELETELLVGQVPPANRPIDTHVIGDWKKRSTKGNFTSNPNPNNLISKDQLSAYLTTYHHSPYGADKSFIYQQYDRWVGGNSIYTSGQAAAAVVRLKNQPLAANNQSPQKSIAITCHAQPLLCFANPYIGGRAIILTAYQQLSAVGAKPMAYTNNLNFGNPEEPKVMAQFSIILEQMGVTSKALEFPTISGNVSFYNQSHGVNIAPTPTIGAVGLLTDGVRAWPSTLPAVNCDLVLIGADDNNFFSELACSRYHYLNHPELYQFNGRQVPLHPTINIFDIEREKTHSQWLQKLYQTELQQPKKTILAVKPVSAAGILCDLLSMVLNRATRDPSLTLELQDPRTGSDDSFSEYFWLGLGGARYILAVTNGADCIERAKSAKIPAIALGQVLKMADGWEGLLKINNYPIISMHELKTARRHLQQQIYPY